MLDAFLQAAQPQSFLVGTLMTLDSFPAVPAHTLVVWFTIKEEHSLMKSLPPGPQLPWQAGVHRENINTPHKPGQWIQTQDHAAKWW